MASERVGRAGNPVMVEHVHHEGGGWGEAQSADPFRWHAIGAAVVLTLMLPVLLVLIVLLQPPAGGGTVFAVAERHGLGRVEYVDARATFRHTCSLCHGQDAQGLPRLGKPLRNSAFVQSHSDADLFELIRNGRLPSDPANTTGTPMPARAGNPMLLSDERIREVVRYLRTLQEPGVETVSVEAWIVDTSPPGGGSSTLGGVGHDTFIASCSACHGVDAEGLPNLGKSLAASEFVASKTDEELMKFVKQGRPIWDPQNTTGIDMPPKGGNPALSDEQLASIITFIRSVHKEK